MPTTPRTPIFPSRLPKVGTTIFTVMSALAQEHAAVNLGQGFPDFDCDPALQLARLTARDGTTREEAQRMLAAQAPRAARLAVADDIIHNDGDIAALRDQVETLHRRYVQAAKAQSDEGSR